MDSSPLIKAHDHARAAAVATRQSSDTTIAINEHTLAAGEFANAARATSSVEALRTLKLLEEHHGKLAEILKLPQAKDGAAAAAAAAAGGGGGGGGGEGGDLGEKHHHQQQHSEKGPYAAAALEPIVSRTAQPPGLSQQRRYASRDMSSSIASNLASARGIRSRYRGQPLTPSVSNDQAPGNVEPHLRRDASKVKMQNIIEHQSGRPGWVPPMSSVSKQDKAAMTPSSRTEPASPTRDDGGYARFYNTFGSLINKISAPLAFAGLPLIQEESSIAPPPEPAETPSVPPSPAKHARVRGSPSPGIEPDLSKIYSKATLRALAREGHSANDSFYVVPTTGHTMSYANILNYAEKEKRRLDASAHGELLGPDDDDDDFVDARESPIPLSPGAKRRIVRAHSERDLHNAIEELSLENKSLKDMMDKLTKRLHTFEASAQSSALALAESYRFMRPGSPLSSAAAAAAAAAGGGGGGGGKLSDDAAARKNQELEEQLSAVMKQMERLEKDNRKMQKTLDKYREKWEVLKAGAKARREAQVTGESVEDARQSASQ